MVQVEKAKQKRLGNGANIVKFRELGMLAIIIIVSVLIQMRNPNFLTFENIHDMLTNTAILSILAVGMMLVIITRGLTFPLVLPWRFQECFQHLPWQPIKICIHWQPC